MPAHLTLTTEKAAAILGARRVGAKQDEAAKAAGVPPRTLDHWLKLGRAFNDAEPEERNRAHVALGKFAADYMQAEGAFLSVMRQRVTKATEKDGRLAFDVLRWKETEGERRLKRALLAAQAEVEKARAAGTYVEKHEHRAAAEMTREELLAEARQLLEAELAHGADPVH